MVHPLTKYTKVHFQQTDSFNRIIFISRTEGYRQRPPYTVDTPMWRFVGEKIAGEPGTISATDMYFDPNASPARLDRPQIDAENMLRKRFVNELGDASSFGATLTAELRETWGTVVTIVTRAAKAARQVKSFRFKDAADTLGIPYKETTRRTRAGTVRRGKKRRAVYRTRTYHHLPDGRIMLKSMASGWLMYSYGVKPLYQDIYNGMDVLQRPLPYHVITSTGRGNATRTEAYTDWDSVMESFAVRLRFRAEVSVENPNLWLANQLGLINPAQWALEAVPLSFVVDWFSNLSDVVNSMTDLAGLRLSNTSLARKTEYVRMALTTYPGAHNRGLKQTYYVRTPGASLPSNHLTFAYERFNWQRGANAISLLLGLLPRK